MFFLRPMMWLCGLAVLLHPVFFIIYRLSVFNTVPRDDYAPFLLWLGGIEGGFVPESPYCYRILSMVAALPLYHVLPAIPLTNVANSLSPAYLQATGALSALAFLGWIASALLVYRIAVRKEALGSRDGAIAGVLMLALGLYVQITAIDPLAVAVIAAAILLLERPAWFGALLLGSVIVNEKIALVLAIWLTIRCLTARQDRARFAAQWAIAWGAVAIYGTMLALVRFPGNSYQTTPSAYPVTLMENLGAYATGRGLMLNVLPLLVLAAVAIYGDWQRPRRGLFARPDLLLIPALLLVAILMTHLFQAGRIVMFAAPFLVVPTAAALGRQLDGVARIPTTTDA